MIEQSSTGNHFKIKFILDMFGSFLFLRTQCYHATLPGINKARVNCVPCVKAANRDSWTQGAQHKCNINKDDTVGHPRQPAGCTAFIYLM